MNRRRNVRAQLALATAVCFASLATFAAGAPAQAEAGACERPIWSAVLSWSGSDCR